MTMHGDLIAAIKTQSQARWSEFFDEYAKQVALRIEAAQTPAEAWDVRIQLKNIREMREFFLGEMRR